MFTRNNLAIKFIYYYVRNINTDSHQSPIYSDDVLDIIDAVHRLCIKIDISPKDLSYNIDNISARLMLKHPIDIEKFEFANQDLKLQYNIEKFPGVFIKKRLQTNPFAKRATFILFTSGKINIVGVRTLEILEESAQWITERCALTSNLIE